MAWALALVGLPLLSGGLGLIVLPHGLGLYVLLTATAAVGMFFNGIFNVRAMAYLQMLSPLGQMGKIIGCLSVVFQVGQPAGLLVYGWLLELAGESVGPVLMGGALGFEAFVFARRKTFFRLEKLSGFWARDL